MVSERLLKAFWINLDFNLNLIPAVCMMFGGCLEGIKRVSGVYKEGVLKTERICLESVKIKFKEG